MKGSLRIKPAAQEALAMLGVAAISGAVIFWVIYSELDGSHGIEIAALMLAGILGGGLIRGFVREKRVTLVFVILVAAEVVLLSQAPQPWSGMWLLLVPSNGMGLMVGTAAHRLILASKPKPRDVWNLNGVEIPSTAIAKEKSVSALYSWDEGDSGRFYVQRNGGVFEAVGNPVTGFIVHCTPNSEDEGEWRILGADDANVVEIRLLSGPAYAPKGILTDLEGTRKALLGFFHHRGPDPELPWTSGEDVRTYRFSQSSH
ncbi:hypothetical protein KKR91_01910 [Arthrobacter jiangjiafuii]|uniref:Uncharacterized protein n=1 Tax=Arthrobacter jiangjiafuii TaxID=2817475 RepID=A0A975M5Q2_9MICC|nr:hypothetical protein [Arthrobacter jiangjiafuii]MBP3044734.1 hypothetical protein [Arthrobacter jiangjiafuii]QWC10435.1 hypothetical protein KKR91_01910 [Arthrobacter jiangjiafuii]